MTKHRPVKSTQPWWLAVCAALALSGCGLLLRDTPTPIPTKWTVTGAPAQGRTLVVFLPGRGGSIQDFEQHGIIGALRDAAIDVDTVAVDAHLNYYYKRTV